MTALEQQCDEHRKRAKELKSKSQHLNNVLMTLTPVTPPPTPKRPRLTRAASGPAQITLPLSQLGSLPLGKVLTVAGAQAGGYTFLASPLSGAELAADGSNVTLLEGVEPGGGPGGSGAFVKVLGPQFQLVTLPLAAAQGPVLQQQVSTVTVVDAMATGAEESQEAEQTDGDDGGQPEEEEEEEQ